MTLTSTCGAKRWDEYVMLVVQQKPEPWYAMSINLHNEVGKAWPLTSSVAYQSHPKQSNEQLGMITTNRKCRISRWIIQICTRIYCASITCFQITCLDPSPNELIIKQIFTTNLIQSLFRSCHAILTKKIKTAIFQLPLCLDYSVSLVPSLSRWTCMYSHHTYLPLCHRSYIQKVI